MRQNKIPKRWKKETEIDKFKIDRFIISRILRGICVCIGRNIQVRLQLFEICWTYAQ